MRNLVAFLLDRRKLKEKGEKKKKNKTKNKKHFQGSPGKEVRDRTVRWVNGDQCGGFRMFLKQNIRKCQESGLLSVQEAVEEESGESIMKSCGELHDNVSDL